LQIRDRPGAHASSVSPDAVGVRTPFAHLLQRHVLALFFCF
jgi:hypothetical protein